MYTSIGFQVLHVLIAMKLTPKTKQRKQCEMSIVFGPTFGTFLAPLFLDYSMKTRLHDHTQHMLPNNTKRRYGNIKFKSYHKLVRATVSNVDELPFRAS